MVRIRHPATLFLLVLFLICDGKMKIIIFNFKGKWRIGAEKGIINGWRIHSGFIRLQQGFIRPLSILSIAQLLYRLESTTHTDDFWETQTGCLILLLWSSSIGLINVRGSTYTPWWKISVAKNYQSGRALFESCSKPPGPDSFIFISCQPERNARVRVWQDISPPVPRWRLVYKSSAGVTPKRGFLHAYSRTHTDATSSPSLFLPVTDVCLL